MGCPAFPSPLGSCWADARQGEGVISVSYRSVHVFQNVLSRTTLGKHRHSDVPPKQRSLSQPPPRATTRGAIASDTRPGVRRNGGRASDPAGRRLLRLRPRGLHVETAASPAAARQAKGGIAGRRSLTSSTIRASVPQRLASARRRDGGDGPVTAPAANRPGF